MNKEIAKMKDSLRKMGLSERTLRRAQEAMSQPVDSDISELSKVEYNSPLSTEHWRELLRYYYVMSVSDRFIRPSEVNIQEDWKTESMRVIEVKKSQFHLPISDDGACEIHTVDSKGAKVVKSFTGKSKVWDMVEFAKKNGYDTWDEIVMRNISGYRSAPLFSGMELGRTHGLSVKVKDASIGRRVAVSIKRFMNILSECSILNGIGSPQRPQTEILSIESLWEKTKLLSKPNDIDLCYAKRDEELLPALNSLNPKYVPGIDGDKLYIVDRNENLECPYGDFKRHWANDLTIDLKSNRIKLVENAHYSAAIEI